MSKENVINFYSQILKVAGCEVDAQGNVSQANLMEYPFTAPVIIDGKRLVIPTKEQLSVPDWSNRLAFHPLQENIMQDESVVLAKYRRILNQRIQGVTSLLLITLSELASSSGDTKKLQPEQLEFLTAFKEVDEKTIDVLAQLMKRMPLGSVTHAFVSIYLKKGGVINGKKFSRTAITTFPFYNELIKDQKEVFGLPIRKKDKESFKKIMKFIFPGIGIEGEYNTGTFVKQAPFLTALMTAAGKLMDELNTVIKLFGKFGNLEAFVFDVSWSEFLEQVESHVNSIRMIPALPGCLPEEQTEPVKVSGTKLEMPKPIPETPVHEVKKTPPVMPGSMQTQQPVQPQALDPNFGRSVQPLQPMSPFNRMNPQQIPQQPGIVHTSRGIDPASVMNRLAGGAPMGPQGNAFQRFGRFQQNNFGATGQAHPFGQNSGFVGGGGHI